MAGRAAHRAAVTRDLGLDVVAIMKLFHRSAKKAPRPQPVTSLWGQALFVDVAGSRVTIDFLLSDIEQHDGAPATLIVDLAGESASQERTGQLLAGLAGETAPVLVDVIDGPRGPLVEIISESLRLVLRPDEIGDGSRDRLWRER